MLTTIKDLIEAEGNIVFFVPYNHGKEVHFFNNFTWDTGIDRNDLYTPILVLSWSQTLWGQLEDYYEEIDSDIFHGNYISILTSLHKGLSEEHHEPIDPNVLLDLPMEILTQLKQNIDLDTWLSLPLEILTELINDAYKD